MTLFPMASGLDRFGGCCPYAEASPCTEGVEALSAPEPCTVVRHRSTGVARRYPVTVAMLFLLASVPVLAAVLAGSASLDTTNRPRSPFMADAPQGPVVVPGGESDPTRVRTPLAPAPGAGSGAGVTLPRPSPSRRDQAPVQVGPTPRIESTRIGPIGSRPGTPTAFPSSTGSGINPRGTPEPSASPSTPPASTSPTAPPTSAPPQVSGKGGGIVSRNSRQ